MSSQVTWVTQHMTWTQTLSVSGEATLVCLLIKCHKQFEATKQPGSEVSRTKPPRIWYSDKWNIVFKAACWRLSIVLGGDGGEGGGAACHTTSVTWSLLLCNALGSFHDTCMRLVCNRSISTVNYKHSFIAHTDSNMDGSDIIASFYSIWNKGRILLLKRWDNWTHTQLYEWQVEGNKAEKNPCWVSRLIKHIANLGKSQMTV